MPQKFVPIYQKSDSQSRHMSRGAMLKQDGSNKSKPSSFCNVGNKLIFLSANSVSYLFLKLPLQFVYGDCFRATSRQLIYWLSLDNTGLLTKKGKTVQDMAINPGGSLSSLRTKVLSDLGSLRKKVNRCLWLTCFGTCLTKEAGYDKFMQKTITCKRSILIIHLRKEG